MIRGIGTDIASVRRIALAIRRSGARFTTKIFTHTEILHCDSHPDRYRHYAGIFASKEAVLKAYGMGWYATNWKNIEVVLQDPHNPRINLYNRMKQESEKCSIAGMHLSVSLGSEYAVAVLVMEAYENH